MSGKKMHQSTQESRQRSYERLRKAGVGKAESKRIAEQATREIHEQAGKR